MSYNSILYLNEHVTFPGTEGKTYILPCPETETEYLDVIGTKVLRVFLLAIPLEQK